MGFHYCRWWSADKCSQLAGNCESLSVWVKAALGLLGAGVLVMIIVLPIVYPCRLDSCANDGRCKGKLLKFTCECVNGYTGEYCKMPPAAHLKLKYGDTCGQPLDTERAVGGQKRDIKEHGYQVFFVATTKAKRCGASIIGKRWAITAAHCFDDLLSRSYKVGGLSDIDVKALLSRSYIVAGLSDIGDVQQNDPETYQVINIIKHEGYKNKENLVTIPLTNKLDSSPINDIGLIELEDEIQYSASVYPICLPSVNMCLKSDTMLNVTGWGMTTENGTEPSDHLMGLEVPVFDWQACEQLPYTVLESSNTCAGGIEKKDSCKGDSGGPLAYMDPNGTWTLYGVVSYGAHSFRCGQAKKPGVYARVSSYISWIKRETGIYMEDETDSDLRTDSFCEESKHTVSKTPFYRSV